MMADDDEHGSLSSKVYEQTRPTGTGEAVEAGAALWIVPDHV
jgi:hypothetical protein